MDESWIYFLRWLLLAPPGMNVRNDLAHGFIGDISPIYAALIPRAAALLITVAAPSLLQRHASPPPTSLPTWPRFPIATVTKSSGSSTTPLPPGPITPERRASRTSHRDHSYGSQGNRERAAASGPLPGA